MQLVVPEGFREPLWRFSAPFSKGTMVIPPGSEGVIFRFKVTFEINGVFVTVMSDLMAVPIP